MLREARIEQKELWPDWNCQASPSGDPRDGNSCSHSHSPVSTSEEHPENENRIFVHLIPSLPVFTYIYVQCRACVCLCVKAGHIQSEQ